MMRALETARSMKLPRLAALLVAIAGLGLAGCDENGGDPRMQIGANPVLLATARIFAGVSRQAPPYFCTMMGLLRILLTEIPLESGLHASANELRHARLQASSEYDCDGCARPTCSESLLPAPFGHRLTREYE
jgi:hypothetical protein